MGMRVSAISIIVTISVLSSLALFSCTGNAATYYVDPVGGDDSHDGSSANPWQSVTVSLGKISSLPVKSGIETRAMIKPWRPLIPASND